MTFQAFCLAFLCGFYNPAPVQTAYVTYNANFYNQLDYSSQAFSASYQYSAKSIDATAGFLVSENNFELATDFSIYFINLEKFGAGFNGVYHFKTYDNTFNEHDIILGFDIFFKPVKWFKVNVKAGYLRPCSEIITLRKFGNEWICNNSVYLFCRTQFEPVENLNIYLQASNCELFRYMLFSSASFTLGAEYTFNFGLSLKSEVVSRFIDIICLSARYDSTDFRISAGYRW
ncbi:MAG: hypothetical protein KBT21_06475 [Treponema sp.]|nr:hypothetical protein [Candidatus Treponema merdequi]